MLASLHVASPRDRRIGREMADDAALILEILAFLKEGTLEEAVKCVNELSGSTILLKLTALLCSDSLTRNDLAVRRARRRVLGVLGFGGVGNRARAVDAKSSRRSAGFHTCGDAVPLTPRQTAILRCV